MTVFSSGIIVVPSGTTSTGLEIVQEAELRIPNGARASEIGVSDGGAVVVSNGGRLNLCTVSGGGKATVLNGGWAADVSVDNGGLFLLSSGASSNKTSIFAGGVASIGEDVMATNVTVLNGGTLHVAPAGYAYAPTVSQGGTAFVSAVGIIDSAQVHGSVFVNYKGVFSSSTVNSGGKLVVSSGGTARAIRENGGHVEVADGAVITFASNTIDDLQLENASATIHSGTTAVSVTVNKDGRLTVFSGGKLTGKMTFENGATVSMYDDAIIDFDLTRTKAGENALVNDLSVIQGTPLYTLTVDDEQEKGLYTLADNAADFKGTISVQNTLGESFGTLAVGGSSETDKRRYTLSLTDDILSLTCYALTTGRAIDDEIVSVTDYEIYRNPAVNSGGRLNVSSGGTAEDVLENGGYVYVADGAVVTFTPNTINDLLLNSAFATIHSGTTVTNATVNPGGRLNVSSGGTATDTTVNSGGLFYVRSGGLAEGVLENGGHVEYEDGAEVSFVPNVLSDVRNSATLHSGTTAYNAALRGTIFISGGIVDTASAASKTSLYVCEGGTVKNVTAGGNLNVIVSSGGTAIDTVVNDSNALEICPGAVLNSTTINPGVTFRFINGVTGTNIIENGGNVTIAKNAEVTFASHTFEGLCLSSGYATVHSGTTALRTLLDSPYSTGTAVLTVYEGGLASITIINGKERFLYVSGGGSAVDTTINAGGWLTVWDFGTASGAEVNSGGMLEISSRGTAAGTTINAGGILRASGGTANSTILDGGGFRIEKGIANNTTINSGTMVALYCTANETTVNSGGILHLSSGGSAVGATINSGAIVYISSGGMADGVAVNRGGWVYVSSGGTANSTTVNRRGDMIVNGGFASNTILSGGSFYVFNGGTANNTIVNSSGHMEVASGGTANNTMIDSGAMSVERGGEANRTTVNPSGSLRVYGGTATEIVENGGHVYITVGANAVFASNTFSGLVLSRASATVHSGTTANSTTVNSGGRLDISSGGIATDTTVNSGGKLYVTSGGTASNIIALNGACLELMVAFGTYIHGTSDGVAFEIKDGFISGYTVNDGSYLAVYSGGTANNITLSSGGGLDVFSGGMANGTTVNDESYFVVYSGGMANSTTVNSDGRLHVLSGGTATGKMTFESEAFVSVYKGGIVDFDLVQAGETALVNDLSVIQGTPVYTLTVSTKLTAAGTYEYALADGAAEFDSTISVVNKAGDKLGTLTVGETFSIERTSYTLNLNGSALSVTVVVAPMPPANPAGTKERVSWDPTGADGYLVEYSVDQFGHAIRTATSGTALDLLELPAGTYQWRVEADDGGGWADGNDIQSDNDATPKVLQSNEDGCGDVFFATTDGIWGDDSRFSALALHSGSKNDWAGTHEIIIADGKGRIRNLFFGSSDPNILYLTDGENGDAIFVDDVYSDLPDGVETHQARLFQIREIRAGAGDDIVDMTSQQFEYTGGGLTIRGGGGNDVIWANKGANRLFGDAGNDRIVGASGDDVIAGGEGDDSMHGGGGHDIFTFCGNWGTDTVEQLESGTVTLWFASGCQENWNAGTLAYTDGENSVTVSGVTADRVSLKFGDDGSEQFAALSGIGAFDAFTSEKVFEDKDAGILARL